MKRYRQFESVRTPDISGDRGEATGLDNAELDLVVPFTTPELTRAAIETAEALGAGLNAHIRLLRIQTIPFPLDPESPPVDPEFLRAQMQGFESDLPIAATVAFARDFLPGLCGRLRPGSIVVLSSRRRWWRTRSEKLATQLQKAGCSVLLVYKDEKHA